jgi:hypothetical protein
VITGGRTSFDKNLLLQQSLPVILARMDALLRLGDEAQNARAWRKTS